MVGSALSVTVGTGVTGVTVTVALAGAEVPPAPVQVSVKVVFVVSAPVVNVPLTPCAPVQPPEAVHAVALVLDQVSVLVAPLGMAAGSALNVAIGSGTTGVTATVAPAGAEVPPAPAQVSVNAAFVDSAPVANEPLTGCAPLQPPEAVQAVALVVYQVSGRSAARDRGGQCTQGHRRYRDDRCHDDRGAGRRRGAAGPRAGQRERGVRRQRTGGGTQLVIGWRAGSACRRPCRPRRLGVVDEVSAAVAHLP